MINNKSYVSKSENETKKIAKEIVKNLISNKKRCVVFLKGDLGSGKTTFVRFALEALGLKDDEFEGSPSFTLVNEYKEGIFHMDLYRITSDEELINSGIYDYFSNEGIFFIEWPDKLKIKPDIVIEFKDKNGGRIINVHSS
ncbi:tRNA (adenosine(37)-N6)-threonylcarbamoyltransferase complex ATPase subunit type 1 TsaE [Hippea maritima]|uniref:tRNA threonylcarbamoyladenosine biosynthesis protein TsaE n=1 Tax=Hippea maritima (strain ATCC 700847 / DSM 10411 / MH2) TaxID=760142 RepID=F2LUC4_HIPMA|nr:tRNA (adenosine(37)-N6)-threonylcarbamoyltransferase complex ATPase subunit type 1 TsaE [Hippea maritima]AEA33450.1 Uncharacterized protein family UPF0079, ATPase [Hippea maritima DSM 10411]